MPARHGPENGGRGPAGGPLLGPLLHNSDSEFSTWITGIDSGGSIYGFEAGDVGGSGWAWSKDEKVSLEIFNLLGQKVRTLINKKFYSKGYHTIEWDGKNGKGDNVASGMYVFRLISGKRVSMKKGILIR